VGGGAGVRGGEDGRVEGIPGPAERHPSHDTFYRVFSRLDPVAFGRCVAGWMGTACEATSLRHVAIDGEAVRAAPGSTFNGCLQLVRAWAAENRLILGQVPYAASPDERAIQAAGFIDLRGVAPPSFTLTDPTGRRADPV
jgi:hypothetical protein